MAFLPGAIRGGVRLAPRVGGLLGRVGTFIKGGRAAQIGAGAAAADLVALPLAEDMTSGAIPAPRVIETAVQELAETAGRIFGGSQGAFVRGTAQELAGESLGLGEEPGGQVGGVFVIGGALLVLLLLLRR